MKCPICQHDNHEGAKFCEGCGAKILSVCPRCGSEVGPEAKFCSECGTQLVEAAGAGDVRLADMQKQLRGRIPQFLADRLVDGARQMQGEYRLVTAVFADVVGSSRMARTVPLEQYVETMDNCFKMMVDTISIEYEGSINRFIGDCVLAFFGAPITHENDAEKAILAALDIRNGVKKLNLDISIGINTGMTYVGEMGSDLVYSEQSAWGPDVDFAKRLQDAANPGEVWVGASTHRLTSRAFDFKKPVYIEVKGMEERQIAYPVLKAREHPEKLRGIEGLNARMIGREKEFATLKEAADNLISGSGSIISVIGEAGLGKSRLISELKDYLKDTDVICCEGTSISLGQSISYWPFRDILRMYLGVNGADVETDFARKLRKSMTNLFPQDWRDVLPFLGNLLSIKFGDELDDKLAYFTPEQVRHQTLMRLRGLFTTISQHRPIVLILEDMHWSDDLSLDLVSLLMDDLADNPLMLLCTYRPEREHRSWQISDIASRKCPERYVEITLKNLSEAQSYELVESLLKIENLPVPVRNTMLEKSDGNPFFLEEVIRSLMDSGVVYREDDRWKAKEEIEDVDVPDTIQSVLLSRVDRLGPEAKYVLQCASVIGKLLRYQLLDYLIQHDEDLEAHLAQLEARDLIYEERTSPEVVYAFKNTLTREVTYQGVLQKTRKELHQRVADGIELLYQKQIEDFHEELAYHHRLGGNYEKAVVHLLESGTKAAGQFASQDALRYFDQAEELLEGIAEPDPQNKAMLHGKRGETLQWIGRWTEALKEYEYALQWYDDPHYKAEIYQKIGRLESEEIQDKVSAIKHLELGFKELPRDDTSIQRVHLEYDIGWVEGSGLQLYAKGFRRCQRMVKIAEEMGHQRELAILCACIENFQSYLGNYSDEYSQKAISVAEELDDPPTLERVYYTVANTRLHIRNGRYWTEQSIPYYLRTLEISERIGDTQTQAMTLAWLGMAYRGLRQKDDAIENWEKALDIAAGTKTVFPLLRASSLMEIYGGRDQADMVVSTFSRIMRTLASLEIDEESQARALFMRGESDSDIYVVYRAFRDGYRSMEKEAEFPKVARETLEDLLKDVSSRPQRAWYHIELMNLYMELGDTDSANNHAAEVVSIVEEMDCPDCMTMFYPAYLLLGDIQAADGLAYRFLTRDIPVSDPGGLLSNAQLVYYKLGQVTALQHLYERIESERQN